MNISLSNVPTSNSKIKVHFDFADEFVYETDLVDP